MDALVAAAKAEGGLTTIALPRDWCNYAAAIDGFTAKYGIPINGLNPGGWLEGRAGRDHGQQGQPGTRRAGRRRRRARVRPAGRGPGPLPALQGLDLGHDPRLGQGSADGMWYGDYYGVMSFEVNTKVVTNVPKDWPDLLKPEYKKSVALFGDPLASNQAQSAVWAAGLSRTATTSTTSSQASTSSSSSTMPATSCRSSRARPPSPAATRRSASAGPTTGSPTRTASRAIPRSRSSSRRPAASVACTSRPSARTRRIRTPPSFGWSTCYSDEGQNIWLKRLLQPDPL